MRRITDGYELSAQDLANHLGCHHLTFLDLAVADGCRAPPEWRDPALAVLQERGLSLEQAYLEHLRRSGLHIAEPGPEEDGPALDRTVAAMREGADVIYQATLRNDRWHGRADFLRRVERRSDLGPWSYEVLDAKLARETRASTILQLCLYSDLVERIQGILPENMYVIIPGETFERLPFRVHDFLAYYRLVQRRLEAAIDPETARPNLTPTRSPHCDICRWWSVCDQRRRQDDHLCLVAGISKLQIKELRSWGVNTLTGLSELPLPLERRPTRGAPETYHRVREQARVQVAAQRSGAPVYEPLPVAAGEGLCRLPKPSPGDIFLDLESDPFFGTSGLEYLLGWTIEEAGTPQYHGLWALDPASEKAAFEAFIDFAVARWGQHPGLHIYHFAPYEPAALKRLMGRYATREDELDRLLRAERFIDLHAVARQAIRAGVESYSLKELEQFYGFERSVQLSDARLHLRAFERALELGRLAEIDDEARPVIQGYNLDDCLSTRRLRSWLEQVRAGLVDDGQVIERPSLQRGDPSEELGERQQRVQALYDRLAGDISADPEARDEEQKGRWLLANMLDWHRREKKAVWWEYYRLCGLSDEDLLEERAGLSGLEFVARVDMPARSVVDRYRFPQQECEIRAGDGVYDSEGNAFGEVEAIDDEACTIDIRKGPSIADEHRRSVFSHSDVRDTEKRDSIMRLGAWVADNGIAGHGRYQAARDLLLRRTPRPGAEIVEGDAELAAARAWVLALDRSVLPIQGPPGSGKTHTGAHMITALVRAGRKVGIVALSHQVIRNLLNKVVEIAEAENTPVRCVQKVSKPTGQTHPWIREVKTNPPVLGAIQSDEADVVAGTAWLWSREDFAESVDVLVVDEAGQLSLADVLSVSQAAGSLVLLGDPQQLRQPQQGSHPEGTDVSALEHLLGEHQTIPPERGLFLDQTWRLHPDICRFTSELFYETRLRSRPNLERQVLDGQTRFAGAGLRFVPVPHSGNRSSSPEEVERVAELVDELTSGDVWWTDQASSRRVLELSDILIIAPYNAQVAALTARLPGVRVGTVDKFQGQEAPVVIFSMATSSPEEAPRGMEFLYSLNRLNVAVSRARTACILVASPALFEPECRSPAQMRLANAFCRFLEMAHRV